MANRALDNREGDAVPPEATPVPQSVDGPAVPKELLDRPRKRARAPKPTDLKPSVLDSRGERELPGEDAYKAVPQSVNGPEAPAELLKPRG